MPNQGSGLENLFYVLGNEISSSINEFSFENFRKKWAFLECKNINFKGRPDPNHFILRWLSERVGSDKKRLWNWISRSTRNRLMMTLLKFIVVKCRIRLFPTLISEMKWLGSELPLKILNCEFENVLWPVIFLLKSVI